MQQVFQSSGAAEVINENFEAVKPASMYGRRAPATAGLTWGYYGGVAFGATIADGTLALTASATNYIVASRSTGAVSVATTNTNWNDTTNYYRVYLVVAGAGSVTTYTDYRDFTGSGAGGGGGGMTNPMTTSGDLIRGGASGAPTRLAAGANGTILTMVAGVPAWTTAPAAGMTNPMTAAGDLIYGATGGAPTRLSAAADGRVLTLQSGVPAWLPPSGGGGGLTNWTESVNTAAPNTTTPAVRFLATNAASSVDAVLSPKGFGSISASSPDNAVLGGNKRGTNAVDWQVQRGVAAQVASGAQSVILGGANNTASGTYSIAGGQQNTASGNGSISFGQQNVSSGAWSASVGQLNTASGTHTLALGDRSDSRNLDASIVHSSGSNLGPGACQSVTMHLQGISSGTTPMPLTTTNSAKTATNHYVLLDRMTSVFRGMVAGRTQAGQSCSWEFSGAIAREANAAATTVLAAIVPVSLGATAGASGATLAVTADTTLGSLDITFTGVTGLNFAVTCTLFVSEQVRG